MFTLMSILSAVRRGRRSVPPTGRITLPPLSGDISPQASPVSIDEGLPMPERRTLDEHRRNPDYAGFTWGFVTTRNIPALKKAVRINISLPEALVHEIDEYAQARGMSRSAFLALAAEHEMAEA